MQWTGAEDRAAAYREEKQRLLDRGVVVEEPEQNEGRLELIAEESGWKPSGGGVGAGSQPTTK